MPRTRAASKAAPRAAFFFPPAAAGLVACTVEHLGARVGDAQSTLHDGIISHANEPALRLGVHIGQSCQPAVSELQPFTRRPS
jgi:hypothetical protein